jgi:transposase-like protein
MASAIRKEPHPCKFSESTYSLMEFMNEFLDDQTCLQWLWCTRYSPDGEHALCERCETERVFRRYVAKQQRQDWTCTACGLHVFPTAGTIFHKSSTALHLWFYAMYLMTSTGCGISAKQLERELGVTYKTAWRMFTLIRNELMGPDEDTKLSGQVEMEETYTSGGTTTATTSARCSCRYISGRPSTDPGSGGRGFRGLATFSRSRNTSCLVGTGMVAPLGVFCVGSGSRPSGICLQG